jgi:hypothetical protein
MNDFESAIRDSNKRSNAERHLLLKNWGKPELQDDRNLTRLESLISFNDYDKFMFDLRNLLHELKYCHSEEEFTAIVGVEPSKHLSDNKFHYAFVAGVIEFYAEYHNWSCPDWVFKPDYFLSEDEAWYALASKKERIKLKKAAPEAIAKRNIFTEESALIPW